ncbi:MAG TPA: CBS domain-containing protein [Chitinophagaceae bacterium]|nr:CBS domain-containing protein [Chitinophagaceae bacterium]
MEKLVNILLRKQPNFHTISGSSTVRDALCQMNCENVDYLVVTDEADRFLGVISDHDITSQVMVAARPLEQTLVRDVMNNRLPHASTSDSLGGCMQLMQRHRARYIPVFEGLNFRGVVTSDDLVHELAYSGGEVLD